MRGTGVVCLDGVRGVARVQGFAGFWDEVEAFAGVMETTEVFWVGSLEDGAGPTVVLQVGVLVWMIGPVDYSPYPRTAIAWRSCGFRVE